MQKIISLFQRNYDTDRLVRDEITPGAEWVQAGEGVATRKWDGTACMIRGGTLFKRYDCKHGKQPPPGFEPCQEPDPVSGHWPGWLPVSHRPEDKWFRVVSLEGLPDGTYELIGPKFQTNPERLEQHELHRHGDVAYPDCPRTFDAIREWFQDKDIEGVVWHHPDGRMVKIKQRDFGLTREEGK